MSCVEKAWQKEANLPKTSEKTSQNESDWPTPSAAQETQLNSRTRARHSTDGNSTDEKSNTNRTKWENISINVVYNKPASEINQVSNSRNRNPNKNEFDNKENLNSKSKLNNDSENNNRSGAKARPYTNRAGKNSRNSYTGNRGSPNSKTTRRASLNINSQRWPNENNRYIKNIRISNQHIIQNIPSVYTGAQTLAPVLSLNLKSLKAAGYHFLPLYPADSGVSQKLKTPILKSHPPPTGQPAAICILPPGSDPKLACSMLIRQQIARQVDFYFSPDNLAHDTYLRRNMNPQGWVDLSIIAKFNRVATLCTDLNEIKEAVKICERVDLDWDNQCVRCRNDPKLWVINKNDKNPQNMQTTLANSENFTENPQEKNENPTTNKSNQSSQSDRVEISKNKTIAKNALNLSSQLTPIEIDTNNYFMPFNSGPHSAPLNVSSFAFDQSAFKPVFPSPIVMGHRSQINQLFGAPWLYFPMNQDVSSTFGFDVGMSMPTVPVNSGTGIQHIPVMFLLNDQLSLLENQFLPQGLLQSPINPIKQDTNNINQDISPNIPLTNEKFESKEASQRILETELNEDKTIATESLVVES